jgi:pimeloyl-ACP methyl ester carboxylesterase
MPKTQRSKKVIADTSSNKNMQTKKIANKYDPKTILIKDYKWADVSFNIRDYGEGIPLLFIHGYPFDGSMWFRAVDILLGKSDIKLDGKLPQSRTNQCPFLKYRAIMPDLRGMGKSESPIISQDPTKNGVKIEKYADDLMELLQQLKISRPVIVVGLSMGGYIAVQFADRHKKHLAGLVMCNTKTTSDPPEVVEKRRAIIDKICSVRNNAQGVLESIADSMIPQLFASHTYRDKQDIIDEVKSMILSNNPHGVSAATWGMAERGDTTKLLENVNVPVLAIGTDEDKITPPSVVKKLAKIAKNGKYVEIHNAGHLTPMEQPEQFAIALNNFISEIEKNKEQ